MASMMPFRSLFHADWSVDAKKRWVTHSARTDTGWQVEAPRLVGNVIAFVSELFSAAPPVLAGFDFPIGLPLAYGEQTGFADFSTALQAFGTGEWAEFYLVAETPQQISRTRPFYPRASSSNARQEHLLHRLQMESIDELLRRCDRATSSRRAACPIFWTLGANQVGKAAISGWKEVIVPALRRGAGLWPFDGPLASLARERVLVLAETYPAEAYGHIGIAFKRGMSKRRQRDRSHAMASLLQWSGSRGVVLSPKLDSWIRDGFGSRPEGEDSFDALVGVLGMIEIVDGHRAEKLLNNNKDVWEGWILGQQDL
jgi:hypothetical protein